MLVFKDVVKSFKSNTVLKGLNLSIMPQERVALVGQNGCGKTTLIRCLLGLYQFEGNIEIFETSLKQGREEALMKIAFVPQTPPALKNTVNEIIEMTSHLCQFPAERVEQIAKELGLDINQCRKTPFKNLSGGMKQKLLISCALARRPLLLIMDEPSANLDPQARSVFFRLLAELPTETSMILTSHRVDELSGIVTRVIELDNGLVAMDDVVETNQKDVLTGKKICTLNLKRLPEPVKRSLIEWAFQSKDKEGLIWTGMVASADAFRFHATLTRWSGIIEEVSLKQIDPKDNTNECFNENTNNLKLDSPLCLSRAEQPSTSGATVGKRAMCPLRDDSE